MNKHGIESINFIESVIVMTKAEHLVIKTISDLISWDSEDGEVYISLNELFSKSKAKVFLKGFSLLKEKGLVKRTKRSHYMINPDAFIPPNYIKAKSKWDSVQLRRKNEKIIMLTRSLPGNNKCKYFRFCTYKK